MPTKAATVEMMRELNVRRHKMEYAKNTLDGLINANGLLRKIIEFEKAGYFVPAEYGHSVFYYKELIGEFVKTSYHG